MRQALNEPFERFVDPRLDQSGMSWGNHVELLCNGGQAFPAMLAAIHSARQRIDLIIYTFRADGTGWRFVGAFVAAARRGCRVRVAYDAIGCRGEGQEHFRRLREAGVETYLVNPLLPRRSSHLWYPVFRDHRKILTVDDRVGFVGGLNIGDEYSGHAQDKLHWRDNVIQITGPAAKYLRRLVDASYMDSWARSPATDEETASGGVPLWVHSPEPFDFRRIMQKTFLALVAQARRYVWIMSAYFSPNYPLVAEMKRAVRRGVDVRLILPQHTDIPIVRWVSHAWYERLIRGGIRVYERAESVLHAKAIVADDAVSMIGSANMDARSLYLNREVIVQVFDESFATQVRQMFEEDLARSHEVELHKFRRRHPLRRLQEAAAYMLSPML